MFRSTSSFGVAVRPTDRFIGLSDEWFWIDEFVIPAPTSWVKENAEAVFQRRQAARFSYAQLALEFDVASPTIGAAIRRYLEMHPGEKDEVCLERGGKRRPKFDLAKMCDEAQKLWIEGESKEQLAKKYGCSPPTMHKAIAYTREVRDALANCDGIANWVLLPNVEPGHEEVIGAFREFTACESRL